MDTQITITDNGIKTEYILEEDIIENEVFTGYHKKVSIKDYVLITGDTTKLSDLVKEITVEISYKLANKMKNIKEESIMTLGERIRKNESDIMNSLKKIFEEDK